jgi:hypothetical protein
MMDIRCAHIIRGRVDAIDRLYARGYQEGVDPLPKIQERVADNGDLRELFLDLIAVLHVERHQGM